MNMRTIRFFLVIISAGLIGYYIGVNKISMQWRGYKPDVQVESKEPPPSVTRIDFAPMWAVMDKLEKEAKQLNLF